MKREWLVAKLELVKRALSDDNTVPVFQCFVFQDGKVYAHNHELVVIAFCETTGTFAANGKTLLGLLQNSHGEDVSLTVEPENVLVKAGKSLFKLPYFTEEDFIFEAPAPDADYDCAFALNAEMLDGLAACLTTSGKDMAQPALMGVCLNGPRHALYSTDGDAVTRFVLNEGNRDQTVAILPNSFCESVLKLAMELGFEDACEIQVNNEWAKATLDNGMVYGRVLTVDNPIDHEQLIVDTLKGSPQYNKIPGSLNDALSRARVLADPESARTSITTDKSKMVLLTKTHAGEAKDAVPYSGDAVEANVSAALLQRSLPICTEIAILPNCVVMRNGDKLLQILSNMD